MDCSLLEYCIDFGENLDETKKYDAFQMIPLK